MSQSEVWEDAKRAEALGKERAQLGETVTTMQIEIDSDLSSIDSKLQALEFRRMFKDPLDEANCYLEVQSGSGGTEAQDWAEMLLRMYLRWMERKGFTGSVSEISDGDVAGIKSATVLVKGSYAYGWLKTETGVHRLVRKSPFDSGNRRHTSFASIFISYELELQQRKAEQRQIEDSKADIGWGSQIRSYVLDQSRVKDIRTNVEVTNPTAVLDGDLDIFIEASLKLAN